MTNSSIPVWWAKLGFVSTFLSKFFTTVEPPILVLSLPRSGSSWVGEILGNATNALYLREPVTQSNLALDESQYTVFYVDPVKPLPSYKRFADVAFSGLPIFRRGILRYPKQWSILERKHKRLVIKEVNPLACQWILQFYRPRMIFLVRHPAAVALSYSKLGWININIEKKLLTCPGLLKGPLRKYKRYVRSRSDFWENHGIMQGATLRVVLETLRAYSDYRIITYEDLCANPLNVFNSLFSFASLSFDEKIIELIIDRCQDRVTDNAYGTSRDSSTMINAWRGSFSHDKLNRLRDAYWAFELPWYESPDDW